MQAKHRPWALPRTEHATLQGLDVVWETVGGAMFDTCARHLAVGGRLLVIGLMSVYAAGWPQSQVTALSSVLPSTLHCRAVLAAHCTRR